MTELRILGILVWGAVFLVLLAPFARLILRRARYLDALWSVCLLGAANRLAMATIDIPEAFMLAASITLAVLFVAAVLSYQRADR